MNFLESLQQNIDLITECKSKDKKKRTKVTLGEKKKDPKAKVRNKPDPVFSAGSKNVKDDKDHFPLGTQAQARNALARANQFDKVPSWYKGSLEDLKKKVASAVKKKYPAIEITKKATD